MKVKEYIADIIGNDVFSSFSVSIDNTALSSMSASPMVLVPIVNRKTRYDLKKIKFLKIPGGYNGTSIYLDNYCDVFENLEEVYLPDDLEFLSPGTFKNCSKLKRVIFSEKTKALCIGGYAFLNCTSLEKIILPKNTLQIYSNAFENCTNLKEIYIPNTISFIGTNCFRGCNNLQLKGNSDLIRYFMNMSGINS